MVNKSSQSNKQRVLQVIIDEQAVNRASISKLLNLSKPTVSDIVKQLLDEELIVEAGVADAAAGGGRKPVQLVFNRSKYYVVGLDIGGTSVVIGIVNLAGEVIAQHDIPTQRNLNGHFFETIAERLKQMKAQYNITDESILGMGVGVPGVTNVEEGIVVNAPALSWENFPVREKLEEVFPYPIFVDNDVNSIVLGEYWKGSAKGKSNIIYIAIGTGIGSGIILNGQLYRGSHYSAGEMGYLVTSREDFQKFRPVHQGYGHLESIASGSAIGHQVSKALNRPVTAREAFQLYESGDESVRDTIDFALENLAIGMANYVSLFDPELIIIGGGVSHSYAVFNEQLIQSMQQYTIRSCQVEKTSLGDLAGVVGAAALFLKEHNSIITI